MKTSVQKQPGSKGVTSNLYDSCKVDDRAINWEKIYLLKESLAERNNKTPLVLVCYRNVMGRK